MPNPVIVNVDSALDFIQDTMPIEVNWVSIFEYILDNLSTKELKTIVLALMENMQSIKAFEKAVGEKRGALLVLNAAKDLNWYKGLSKKQSIVPEESMQTEMPAVKKQDRIINVRGEQISTNGKGLWTSEKKLVGLVDVKVEKSPNGFGSMRIYFDPKTWNISKDGLIYTDPKFLSGFRALLVARDFPVSAVRDLNYSEQGMQGRNFVHMEFGPKFSAALEAERPMPWDHAMYDWYKGSNVR